MHVTPVCAGSGEGSSLSHLFSFFQVLQRLVNCLDHCASRTGSLPLQTVGLLPLHCSRFSLSCLQMMFSLCRYVSFFLSCLLAFIARICIIQCMDHLEISWQQ
jgi:hypothetical protein